MTNNIKCRIDMDKMKAKMVNSYKLFWLKGIYLEVISGKKDITFKEIASRMISEAWDIVLKYNPNLGTSDQLNYVVMLLKEKHFDYCGRDKQKVYDALIQSTSKEIEDILAKFYSYVPFRLLSPFYKEYIEGKKDSEQNKIIETKSQQDDKVIYKLYNREKRVMVNENWVEYFRTNSEEVKEWFDFEIKKYIMNKNLNLTFEDEEELLDEEEDEDELEINESIEEPEIITDYKVDESIDFIYNYITSSGYTYSKSLIKNIYLSLKTKPFLILSGISGTGKSKIIELFARALGATAENRRFNLIPVKPDWSDSTDLLGYRNIEGQFIPGIITKICKEAMEHKNIPYFIVLDEMNLARVEYYFSDILSLMETRRKNEEGEIITNNLLNKDMLESTDSDAFIEYGEVYIPENVYIVGTVNMDETTFPFSRKVLDRANTIEFNKVDLNYDFDSLFNDTEEPRILHNDFLKSRFLKIKDCIEQKDIAKETIAQLIEINNILEKYNFHFAYRVRDEIVFYMIYASEEELLSFNEALDNCIVQKILPKINGSSNECYEVLLDLFEHLTKIEIKNRENLDDKELNELEEKAQITPSPLASEKLLVMIRRFVKDGFTNFW